MARTTLMILALLATGCRNKVPDTGETGRIGGDSGVVTTDAQDSALLDDTGDTGTAPLDADGDGSPADEDCDDDDPAVNPGAAEVCNGIDDDCDLLVDDEDPDVVDPLTWYGDLDGDGWGDADNAVSACDTPSLFLETDGDCDDADAEVNPDATEVCNGLDDDCDTLVDDDDDSVEGRTTWYLDEDADSYGGTTDIAITCDAPEGFTDNADDCDDEAATTFPGATERCNDADDDCDLAVDEGAHDAVSWYSDVDGDGHGDPSSSVLSCDPGSGFVTDDGDCDDGDAAVSPSAAEVCNGADDDCDALVDDDDPDLTDPDRWYDDSDGDGYGDAGGVTLACEAPSDTVADDTDCDDSDSAVSPGAAEVCNGADDDCDGATDDDDSSLDTTTGSTWYVDSDGDGYGDATLTTLACDQPSGTTPDSSDCDDGSGTIYPGATDSCNGVDDDCSGLPDDTGTCPCSVEHSGDRPYMFCESGLDWVSAQSTCATYGYHLLSIGDSTEDSWADGIADTYSTEKWWTGLNDRGSEGTFTWESGESVSYTNWASGEPNDSGGEDCVQMNRYHPDTTWNDEPCGSAFRYVCEFD